MSLFSVTFCRQIMSNSVFQSATEDKIKQQHHLFVLAHSSFKRDAEHDEAQKKVKLPAELSALKLRELATPFLEPAPSFTFCLAISVFVPSFFFLFVSVFPYSTE